MIFTVLFLLLFVSVMFCGAFGWWGLLAIALVVLGAAALVGYIIWREEQALEKLFNKGKSV